MCVRIEMANLVADKKKKLKEDEVCSSRVEV